jgi:hypothetical protein
MNLKYFILTFGLVALLSTSLFNAGLPSVLLETSGQIKMYGEDLEHCINGDLFLKKEKKSQDKLTFHSFKRQKKTTEIWNFKSLNEVFDGSQNMKGQINYSLQGDTLRMYTRANTYDRPKVRSKEKKYLTGTYSWRVFVPNMGKGDMASIGCFLYYDDLHELDFEIGYGKEQLRKKSDAKDDEVLCYITSQGNPWHQKIKPIKTNAWYDCSIKLSEKKNNYFIEWFVNNKLFSSRQLEFGKEIPFYIYSSFENLTFMGDHIAKQQNYTLFDYMKFEGSVVSQ